MGYSVPAAVGAKIAFPDRMVVSMVGDGGFLMTGQEIATAFHHGVAPIVLVFNNQMYGTIRMHQERAYPWPCLRHRADQSRFRALHRSVRRPRRGGQRTDGIRAGVPPRGGERQARRDRIAHEPGADHHARHDRRPARRQDATEGDTEAETSAGAEASRCRAGKEARIRTEGGGLVPRWYFDLSSYTRVMARLDRALSIRSRTDTHSASSAVTRPHDTGWPGRTGHDSGSQNGPAP